MTKKTKDVINESLDSVKQELIKVQEELNKLKTEKLKFSDVVKDEITKIQEELDDTDQPLIYLDSKYRDDEKYNYRCVDITRAGRLDRHLRLGYEVVTHDDRLTHSDNLRSNSGDLTSAVTAELGYGARAIRGVWMRIPKEKYEQRQKAKARKVQEQTDSMMEGFVNSAHSGTIEIGNKIYKK